MRKSYKNLPIAAVFISIISVFILSQFFSTDFRMKILNIFRVPLKTISSLTYFMRDASGFRQLTKENEILRENVSILTGEVTKLREAQLENKRLKELLDFAESGSRKVIPAMVIAKDPLGMGNSVIIDKGKKNNVTKDMVVISGNALVGRVRETGWGIARVLLITDTNSVVGCIVQETRDEGSVAGNSQSGLIMKYLELASEVKKGDKVITSGFGGIFGKGILVGEIAEVIKDSSGLYLDALVRPEVDMEKLEEVLVIQ